MTGRRDRGCVCSGSRGRGMRAAGAGGAARSCRPVRRGARRRLGSALLLSGWLAATLPALPARAQSPDPRDYQAVTMVARRGIDAWLKDEVRRSGGTFNRERYRFVIGFSTGHFGSDPVHAIAMRRLAFSVLNNTLAAGDRVTPVAWEMQVWSVGEDVLLTQDPRTRAQFVDDVPYAPAAGSRGGHDTERALYDVLTNVVGGRDPKSTVVLLLTNTNQSQGPTGSRAELFGANHPRLLAAIRQGGFRPPVRKSFTAETRKGRVTIDVTALFPRQIASLPGAPSGPRYPTFPLGTWQPPADQPRPSEPLPNPVLPPQSAPVPPQTPPRSGPELPWPWILGGLALLAGIAFLLLRRRPEAPGVVEPKPPPKGKALPGVVKATLGSAPNSTTVTLSDLRSESRWTLVQDESARPSLTQDEKPEGTPVARLALDERRRMTVQAEGDCLFRDVQGVKPDAANPRQLVLKPGDLVVCRVASATTERTPLRLELNYLEKGPG